MSYRNESPIIDGSNSDEWYLFDLTNSSNIIIDGIGVTNAPYVAFGGIDCSSIQLVYCWVNGAGDGGAAIVSGADIVIQHCSFTNISQGQWNEGLYLAQTSNFNVSYNTLTNCGREGIDILNGSHDGVVSYNIVDNASLNNKDDGRPAIYCDAWSRKQYNIDILNNQCMNSPVGIALAAENGGQLSNIIISENIITNCSEYGIAVTAWGDNPGLISHVRIDNNVIDDVSEDAIFITSHSELIYDTNVKEEN